MKICLKNIFSKISSFMFGICLIVSLYVFMGYYNNSIVLFLLLLITTVFGIFYVLKQKNLTKKRFFSCVIIVNGLLFISLIPFMITQGCSIKICNVRLHLIKNIVDSYYEKYGKYPSLEKLDEVCKNYYIKKDYSKKSLNKLLNELKFYEYNFASNDDWLIKDINYNNHCGIKNVMKKTGSIEQLYSPNRNYEKLFWLYLGK